MHLWVSQLTPDLREKVSSYRAGFLAEERRWIEGRLARGDLLGVVSTSALEMGSDIGGLDICLLVGYPGTMITTWQRGGRVGRAGRDSLIILVGKPDALDQYFMKHPDELFERKFEAAVLDPDNSHVVRAHLPCAASEYPLTMKDVCLWPGDFERRLEELELEGALLRSATEPPGWFRDGEMEKLTDYCRRDVRVTRDLFLHGLEHKHLVYRPKGLGIPVRLPVDWDLERIVSNAAQRSTLSPGKSAALSGGRRG